MSWDVMAVLFLLCPQQLWALGAPMCLCHSIPSESLISCMLEAAAIPMVPVLSTPPPGGLERDGSGPWLQVQSCPASSWEVCQ